MADRAPTKPIATVRLDKWLWAVRLFKTRGIAAVAASSRKVKRDEVILKPSTALKIGQILELPAADGSHKRTIEVVQLLDRRVGAALARQAYTEHTAPEILQEVAKRNALNRADRLARKEGDQGRMTKRSRRVWAKNQQEQNP